MKGPEPDSLRRLLAHRPVAPPPELVARTLAQLRQIQRPARSSPRPLHPCHVLCAVVVLLALGQFYSFTAATVLAGFGPAWLAGTGWLLGSLCAWLLLPLCLLIGMPRFGQTPSPFIPLPVWAGAEPRMSAAGSGSAHQEES